MSVLPALRHLCLLFCRDGGRRWREKENTSTYAGVCNLKVVVIIMESSMTGSIRGCGCLLRMIVTKGLFRFLPRKLLGLFGTLLTLLLFFFNIASNATYLF